MEIANYVDKVRPGVYFVGKVPAPQRGYRTGDHVAPELPVDGQAAQLLRGNRSATEARGGRHQAQHCDLSQLISFGL